MKSLKSIKDKYSRKRRLHNSKRDNIEKELTLLEEKRKKLGYISWIDELLRPIAEEVIKKYPDRTYDILGPFGLGSKTAIHLYKKGVKGDNLFKGKNCLSITFEPKDLDKAELEIVDYSKDTKRYAKNTIGEMNGFNYLTIPIKSMKDILNNIK